MRRKSSQFMLPSPLQSCKQIRWTNKKCKIGRNKCIDENLPAKISSYSPALCELHNSHRLRIARTLYKKGALYELYEYYIILFANPSILTVRLFIRPAAQSWFTGISPVIPCYTKWSANSLVASNRNITSGCSFAYAS